MDPATGPVAAVGVGCLVSWLQDCDSAPGAAASKKADGPPGDRIAKLCGTVGRTSRAAEPALQIAEERPDDTGAQRHLATRIQEAVSSYMSFAEYVNAQINFLRTVG